MSFLFPPPPGLSAEDVHKILLAFVDLVQDPLVVLLQELLGHVVLLGEEAVELAGFFQQLALDVVDHARDYMVLLVIVVQEMGRCNATYRLILSRLPA